jgi:hypothetical protein
MMLMTSKPVRTVAGLIKRYGFCNWQAQELIKERDVLLLALEAQARFWEQRIHELGELSPEAQAVYDRVAAAIITVHADDSFLVR